MKLLTVLALAALTGCGYRVTKEPGPTPSPRPTPKPDTADPCSGWDDGVPGGRSLRKVLEVDGYRVYGFNEGCMSQRAYFVVPIEPGPGKVLTVSKGWEERKNLPMGQVRREKHLTSATTITKGTVGQ